MARPQSPGARPALPIGVQLPVAWPPKTVTLPMQGSVPLSPVSKSIYVSSMPVLSPQASTATPGSMFTPGSAFTPPARMGRQDSRSLSLISPNSPKDSIAKRTDGSPDPRTSSPGTPGQDQVRSAAVARLQRACKSLQGLESSPSPEASETTETTGNGDEKEKLSPEPSESSVFTAQKLTPKPEVQQASRERRISAASSQSVGRLPRSGSFCSETSYEGMARSTSCKSLRSNRSRRTSFSQLSMVSLSPSEAIQKEHASARRCMEREQRWLKRALSEEIRKIGEMQEQDAAELERTRDRTERQKQAESRQRQRSLKLWENSCKVKFEEEKRQKQEAEEREAAFGQNQQRLQAERQQSEKAQAAERERQALQAEKRRQMLTDLERKREAEQKELQDKRVRQYESEQARDQAARSEQAKQQQQQEERRRQREEKLQKLQEAQREQEERRTARLEEKQRLQQQLTGAFTARQRSNMDKMHSLHKELEAKRLEARVSSDQMKERRRSEVEHKARSKSEKLEGLESDRQKLWELRKNAHREAQKILRTAKAEVQKQAASSRYSVKWLEDQVGRLEADASLGALSQSSSHASLHEA